MGTGDETDGGGNGKALGGARERSPHDQVRVAHGDGAANRASPARSASQQHGIRAGDIRGPRRHSHRNTRSGCSPSPPPTTRRYASRTAPRRTDQDRGAQGMAIKLLDVPGRKILEKQAEAGTHDFILIDGPVFFVRDTRFLCPPGPRAGAPAARQAAAEMARLDQADPSGGRRRSSTTTTTGWSTARSRRSSGARCRTPSARATTRSAVTPRCPIPAT